jgi:hypothetical protein
VSGFGVGTRGMDEYCHLNQQESQPTHSALTAHSHMMRKTASQRRECVCGGVHQRSRAAARNRDVEVFWAHCIKRLLPPSSLRRLSSSLSPMDRFRDAMRAGPEEPSPSPRRAYTALLVTGESLVLLRQQHRTLSLTTPTRLTKTTIATPTLSCRVASKATCQGVVQNTHTLDTWALRHCVQLRDSDIFHCSLSQRQLE